MTRVKGLDKVVVGCWLGCDGRGTAIIVNIIINVHPDVAIRQLVNFFAKNPIGVKMVSYRKTHHC